MFQLFFSLHCAIGCIWIYGEFIDLDIYLFRGNVQSMNPSYYFCSLPNCMEYNSWILATNPWYVSINLIHVAVEPLLLQFSIHILHLQYFSTSWDSESISTTTYNMQKCWQAFWSHIITTPAYSATVPS